MAIISLDSDDPIAEFFAIEERAQAAANARVKPEQIVEVGEYCVGVSEGIRIYSEILDAAAMLLAGRDLNSLDEDERAEYDSVRETYADPGMKFYRFTRSYSVACVSGELGDRHLSTVSRKLTKAEFEAARQAGWP
jgi:hypothetical protein